jgi:DNA repair exonuclease SbcCD ATPase subunit
MILSKVVLQNWMRFRGEHVLHLEPKVYAISARRDGDVEMSNWQGKTSLVEAIRFALYGEHRFRTEDEWLTRGEDSGGVELQFDSNYWVDRSRKRGTRTALKEGFLGPAQPSAKGDFAQVAIVRVAGLDLRDFEATVYFGQRGAAQLVLTEASRRMEVVEGWLRLEPLMRAEAHNADKIRTVEAKLAAARAGTAFHVQVEARELDGQTLVGLEQVLSRASQEGFSLAADIAELEGQLARTAEMAKAEERAAAYQRLVEEGKELAALVAQCDLPELEKSLADATRAKDALMERKAVLTDEVEKRRSVARGKFSGTCPVAGFACPATDKVNAMTEETTALHEAALHDHNTVYLRLRAASDVERELREKWDHAREMRSRLEAMRERAKREKAEVPSAPSSLPSESALLPELLGARRQDLEASKEETAQIRGRIGRVREAMRQREVASKEVIQLQRQLTTLQEAAQILGRRGARRTIAEPFLEELETGANEALAECGVDLSVKVLWEHEGKDLARTCPTCGSSFPESARVKECERCGAARGRNVINRLEFEFSDRSAAAEDLAGVAIQLAASAWLRRARGSALSIAVLDEPMAHCDKANRRALTRAFTQMLAGRFQIAQAFVVTHTAESNAFPGSIVVTGKGSYSTVEVVS